MQPSPAKKLATCGAHAVVPREQVVKKPCGCVTWLPAGVTRSPESQTKQPKLLIQLLSSRSFLPSLLFCPRGLIRPLFFFFLINKDHFLLRPAVKITFYTLASFELTAAFPVSLLHTQVTGLDRVLGRPPPGTNVRAHILQRSHFKVIKQGRGSHSGNHT